MHALCDRALFFLHIPKTAGTSLRELLSPRFSRAEILAFERSDSRELRDEKLASVDRYRFVHGHVPYALAGRFERRPFVATILRDPLERAVSAFHYMQGQVLGPVSAARARDYTAAGRMPIGELIRREPLAASRHLGNLQAWILSTPNLNERFEYGVDHRVAVSGSDLERAKEHLAACDFIGLTERMNESVDLLSHALQARPLGEVSTANRSPARLAVAELDPPTMTALADLTAQDRELYTFACRLFEERRRAMTRELLNPDRTRLEAGHPPPAPIFTFDGAIPGDGWYAPERDGERWFSWTGPACDSTLELASPAGQELVFKLGVLHAMQWESLSSLEVRLNNVRLCLQEEPGAAGRVLTAIVPRGLARAPGESNSIGIRVPEVLRPCEQDPAAGDSRLLGIAVHRIELAAIEPAGAVSRLLRTFRRL
jgi:hypothetical protein